MKKNQKPGRPGADTPESDASLLISLTRVVISEETLSASALFDIVSNLAGTSLRHLVGLYARNGSCIRVTGSLRIRLQVGHELVDVASHAGSVRDNLEYIRAF